MERRFMLYEVESFRKDTVYKEYATTETELKRRILMLTGGDYRDGDIEILLYGERNPPPTGQVAQYQA